MDEFLKQIQCLNSENCQEFIFKYGKINDIELAKECLILNPNTWYCLDEDLKQNPLVVAHYIPTGYYVDNISIDKSGSVILLCWEFSIKYTDVSIPVGFKDASGNIVPDIEFPDGFSEEDYLEILNSIPQKKETIFSNLDVDVMAKHFTLDKLNGCKMYSVYGNLEETIARKVKLPGRSTYRCDRVSFTYDRSKIKEAINEFYKNAKKKRKQKKKK